MDELGATKRTRRTARFWLVLATGFVVAFAITGSATAVIAVAPTNSSPPTVSGTAQQGQTLTAANGTWSGTDPITFTYSWQRCDTSGGHCGDIKGATASTYVLAKEDVNHTVRVAVTTKNNEGANTALSSVTAAVTATTQAGAPANTALPTITGQSKEGQTLTASTGTWSGTAPITFTYTWERCDATGGHCGNIGGTNHPTYTVQNADVGKTVRVAVAAKNSVATTTATSAASAVVAAATTPAPPATTLTLTSSSFSTVFGTSVTLTGALSTKQGGQTITIEAQDFGAPKPTKLGTTTTAADGTWSFKAKPTIQTVYDAQAGAATSGKATVGVKPLVTFHTITNKRFSTKVVAGHSFSGKLVQLQRRSGAKWVTLKKVRLGSASSAIFRATLPKGASTLRIAFSVNQAGAGYLGGTSRTITYAQS